MDIDLIVKVNGQYGSYGAGIKVPELQLKAFEPLKTTDDPMMAMVTGEQIANNEACREIIKTRKDAAKVLAKALADHIVKEMEKNDTHNGYGVWK